MTREKIAPTGGPVYIHFTFILVNLKEGHRWFRDSDCFKIEHLVSDGKIYIHINENFQAGTEQSRPSISSFKKGR